MSGTSEEVRSPLLIIMQGTVIRGYALFYEYHNLPESPAGRSRVNPTSFQNGSSLSLSLSLSLCVCGITNVLCKHDDLRFISDSSESRQY